MYDFEASKNENVFAFELGFIKVKRGALLVANSEAALLTQDVDNGWDWTRHPGATTLNMNIDQLLSENRRFEN